MTWHFPERSVEQSGGNSIVSEFFGGDRKVRPDDFVRETVQNALDASHEGSEVSVNFRLGRLNDQDSDEVRRRILTSKLHDHVLDAELEAIRDESRHDNERKRVREMFSGKIEYLVVEDTGTTGLNGPVDMQFKVEDADVPNAMTCFFRLNGQSGKTGHALGSFGVGRHVFYSASRVATFMVHTMPVDSRAISRLVPGDVPELESIEPCPLLLGMSLQQTRNMHNDLGELVRFDNYLPFGVSSNRKESKGVVLPLGIKDQRANDVEFIHQLFDCVRPQAEPGSSMIVLQPRKALDRDRIKKAVITDFALPILRDDLRVRVDGIDIDSESIVSLAHEINPNLAHTVTFMAESIKRDSDDDGVITLGKLDDDGPEYGSDHFDDEDHLKTLSRQFRNGEPVSFRVSMNFFDTEQDGDVTGSFRLHLRRCASDQRGKILISRSGLVIRGSKYTDSRFLRDYNGFLDLEAANPLTDILRRAEGPAHDEWKVSRIDEECTQASRLIRLVRDAAKSVSSILMQHGVELDRSIFADLLPASGGGSGRGRGPRAGGNPPPTPPPPRPTPPPSEGMFEFPESGSHLLLKIAAEGLVKNEDRVEVKLAYDCRVGSPFKKWSETDFSLKTLKISDISTTGLRELEIIDGQTLHAVVANRSTFEMGVPLTLFDPDYDVRMRAERLGGAS